MKLELDLGDGIEQLISVSLSEKRAVSDLE